MCWGRLWGSWSIRLDCRALLSSGAQSVTGTSSVPPSDSPLMVPVWLPSAPGFHSIFSAISVEKCSSFWQSLFRKVPEWSLTWFWWDMCPPSTTKRLGMSISDRPGLGHLNLSGPGSDPNKIKVINTGNKCFVAKKDFGLWAPTPHHTIVKNCCSSSCDPVCRDWRTGSTVSYQEKAGLAWLLVSWMNRLVGGWRSASHASSSPATQPHL